MLCTFLLALALPAFAQDKLPEGPGKAAMYRVCKGCHPPETVAIKHHTREEWEEFESGFAAGSEEWLLANPGHPQAAEVIAKLDAHRDIWLRGHRDVLGFAFLTLGVPVAE